MTSSDVEVVIVGGGAAGIAAGRRLREAAVPCLIVEGRPRLGGRAWTVIDSSGAALDLGCGWLHSADRNPWCDIARGQGRAIDRTPAPWQRPSLQAGFPRDEQQDFQKAMAAFYRRLGVIAAREPDSPCALALEPGCRWNPLINAVSTYIAGAELDRVSAHDLENYQDSGVNFRVREGYGATIAAAAADLNVRLDCPVRRVDHGGRRLRVETAQGAIAADRVIVTLPSAVLAAEQLIFAPALPEKIDAAAGLPLGLDDKLFLSLDGAEEFEADSRLFARTDRTATAAYHMRPFGRPQIEAFFGGTLAVELEIGGIAAFFDYAVAELTGLFGAAFARRLAPLGLHCWRADRFALGSYSYALPGRADCRAALAASVDDRLFFAGEACSPADFSTAHGAYLTGVAAADAVIAARNR